MKRTRIAVFKESPTILEAMIKHTRGKCFIKVLLNLHFENNETKKIRGIDTFFA